MFGYILPEKGELKVKEYEVYSAYYCGICKNISQRYGQLPRLALNYDFVFLAVLLAALEDRHEHIDMEHCVLHHIKKKAVAKEEKAIDYAADITLIMAYYKLVDDYNDDGDCRAKLFSMGLEGTLKRIRKQYADLCSIVKTKLEELSVLEKSRSDELDRVMEPFAEIMREVFRQGIDVSAEKDNEADKKLMSHIGYHLGKWVYLIDAYEDVEENIEKNTYNPLLYRFNYDKEKESVAEFKKRIRETVSFNLMHYLAEMSKAVDLLDLKRNRGIVENIVYFGLRRKTENILNKEEKEEEKI